MKTDMARNLIGMWETANIIMLIICLPFTVLPFGGQFVAIAILSTLIQAAVEYYRLSLIEAVKGPQVIGDDVIGKGR